MTCKSCHYHATVNEEHICRYDNSILSSLNKNWCSHYVTSDDNESILGIHQQLQKLHTMYDFITSSIANYQTAYAEFLKSFLQKNNLEKRVFNLHDNTMGYLKLKKTTKSNTFEPFHLSYFKIKDNGHIHNVPDYVYDSCDLELILKIYKPCEGGDKK